MSEKKGMSKKAWFVLILIAAIVIYIVASKLHPPLDAWTSTNILIPIHNALLATGAAIQANPIIQQYIGWIGLVVGFIGGLLMYNMFSQKKIPFTKTPLPKGPYQHAPTSSPQQIPQQVDLNIKIDKPEGEKTEEKT